VFATCLVLFRFYGSEYLFGKAMLALAAMFGLWSMTRYAAVLNQLSKWTINSFAEQHIEALGGFEFATHSPEAPALVKFLLGFEFAEPGAIREINRFEKELKDVSERALSLQFVSCGCFAIGLIFFAIANF
ncbi:MAG: hypothetical protein AAFQ06_10935, partial [Pseudomonadota bacterium]